MWDTFRLTEKHKRLFVDCDPENIKWFTTDKYEKVALRKVYDEPSLRLDLSAEQRDDYEEETKSYELEQ